MSNNKHGHASKNRSDSTDVLSDRHGRYKQIILTTMLLLALLSSTLASKPSFADGAQRTRAEAVEIARQQSGNGRVLSVKKTTNSNGVSIYAVKIISNGRVKIYRVKEFTN